MHHGTLGFQGGMFLLRLPPGHEPNILIVAENVFLDFSKGQVIVDLRAVGAEPGGLLNAG
eukprot:scaffold26199_cov215-Cylindrotheca_fusiformis.AAC.3